ncbi:MAG TPA: SPOR domain-containing protein, partial [Terracidiphilus sp.]|nr:SPOR domain-containing protein [Terracidiphilus sp.]
GYAVGHHGSPRSTAANAPTPAPDQEPLQPNESIPKPSASQQPAVPAPQTGDSPANPEPGTPAAGENPATTTRSPGNGEPGGSPTGSPAAKAPGAAQPALPSAGNTAPNSQGGATPNVRAALPVPTKLMVQIAAVAHPEDADVLVAALRKRGYSVTAMREPADGLIHVRIGPFSSRDEANRWRDKLLGDGYNAEVQL